MLNENSLTKWFNTQTKSVGTNINNAVNSVSMPKVEITIDDKTQKTVVITATILSVGMVLNALLSRNK